MAHITRWVLILMLLQLVGTPAAGAELPYQKDNEVAFIVSMTEGTKAFQAGHLKTAREAFHAAYLIHPDNAEVRSWLAIIQEQQGKRDAIASTVTELRQTKAALAAEHEQEPLAEHLRLPNFPPLSLSEALHPVEQTRREILTGRTRAGFQGLYKEGIGFQPIRGLGFSGRTEIYAEPFPIDGLELDSKVLNVREISQYRRSILPLFTRSGASRVVLDVEPLPRLTYEFDGREVLHQYQTKYAFKDIDLETHAVNALYSFPELPWFGVLTVNPWYKRVLQRSDFDLGSYEDRNELIANFSLQQTPNIEYFFQTDMYAAKKRRVIGGSKLMLFKGQVRLRVPQLRLFLIPSIEYSRTTFDPSDDEYVKRDIFVDWGFDITEHLRASSKEEVVHSSLSQPATIPSHPDAQVFNCTNTLSYELFKDFDVSLGLDYSKGFGFSNYNNVGFRAEVEFFKPGFLRSKVGYEWLSYYNIQDDQSLIYWKFFLFQ